jgi:hypothetical protein
VFEGGLEFGCCLCVPITDVFVCSNDRRSNVKDKDIIDWEAQILAELRAPLEYDEDFSVRLFFCL